MKDDRTGLDVASVGDAEGVAALVGLDAPTADASLEALGRIVRAAWVEVAKKEAKTVPGYVDLWKWLEIPDADTDREIGEQVVRAVDASRPAAPTPERTFPRVTLSTVTPGSLVEIASGDICLVLDGCYGEAPRYVVWVATGRTDTMPASATVSLRATPVELDALTSADACRPGLTEEQARRAFEAAIRDAATRGGPYCITHAREAVATLDAALLRASRGETGLDDQAVCMAAAAKAGWTFDRETGRWTGPLPSDPAIAVEMRQWEADVDAAERAKLSRGETGAVPTGLTRAMHDAQQRPGVAPASPFGEWPDEPRGGLTCPGCYAATGIAQPHDPRATLHAGDPQKSGGNAMMAPCGGGEAVCS